MYFESQKQIKSQIKNIHESTNQLTDIHNSIMDP